MEEVHGKKILKVSQSALTRLSEQAYIDIAHLLRPGHLKQLSNILKDEEASNNDKFVALELLKNANIASGMVLPGCQDTGTAICMGLNFLKLNLQLSNNFRKKAKKVNMFGLKDVTRKPSLMEFLTLTHRKIYVILK